MTRTVCIIQARLASTRLPAKVLLPLPTGRTVLEEVVYRCKQVEGVDWVVVAIPDDEASWMMLSPVVSRAGATRIFRGSERDVLGRYHGAMHDIGSLMYTIGNLSKHEAVNVLRVTSDCPLIDPVQCARVLASCDRGSRYARLSAGGWSCEAFTAEALDLAHLSATSAYDREHVGPWMAENVTPIGAVMCTKEPPPSLDTLDDYIRIWKIFEDQIASDPSLRAA